MREKNLSWRDICKMKEDPPFFTKVFFDSYIGTHAIVLIVNLTSQWHTVNFSVLT